MRKIIAFIPDIFKGAGVIASSGGILLFVLVLAVCAALFIVFIIRDKNDTKSTGIENVNLTVRLIIGTALAVAPFLPLLIFDSRVNAVYPSFAGIAILISAASESISKIKINDNLLKKRLRAAGCAAAPLMMLTLFTASVAELNEYKSVSERDVAAAADFIRAFDGSDYEFKDFERQNGRIYIITDTVEYGGSGPRTCLTDGRLFQSVVNSLGERRFFGNIAVTAADPGDGVFCYKITR